MTIKPYTAYKRTNLAWLPQVPEHWEMKPILAITRLKSIKGRTDLPLLSVYRDFGVILKDSRDDNHNKAGEDLSTYKVVEKGDLVLNKMKAWQGSMGISEHDGIVSPAYIVCKVDKRINQKFLHTLLRCANYINVYNTISYGVRVDQWDMRYQDFKRIPIFIPPPAEQTAIAEFLDRKTTQIDTAIAKKKQLIELLKEQKQAMINKAVTEGLNGKTDHWERKKLKYVARIIYGQSPHESTYNQDGIGSILINGPVEYSDTDFGYTKSSKWTTEPKKFAPKGSLLFCLRGSTTGRLNICHEFVSIGRGVAALISNEKILDYQYFIFSMFNLKNEIQHSFEGSTFPSVTSSDLNNYTINIPPLAEQAAIVAHIEQESQQTDTTISRIEREIELLKEYRTTLIANAVTGRIKVI